MNTNTPNSGVTVVTPETTDLYIAFRWSGFDNGDEKNGFDSRVVKIPKESSLATTADFQGLAEELGKNIFKDRKYVGLEVTIMNVIKLPIL